MAAPSHSGSEALPRYTREVDQAGRPRNGGPGKPQGVMVESSHLNDLRRKLYECTQLSAEAINPKDMKRWHVDVFQGEHDPMLDIVEHLEWSESPGVLGLSGGSGVGKTTELMRLREYLWERSKTVVIRVGYEDYSSLSSPPDITDFLLSIVGGLEEESRKLGLLGSSYLAQLENDSFMAMLKRLRLEPEIAFGGVKVKASLHEDESFRKTLREHLKGQVSQLVHEVRAFAGLIVSSILSNAPGAQRVLMIVDSTERLNAPASAEEEMRRAVKNLFIHHAESLSFPCLSTLYLVPAWLTISDGGSIRFPVFGFPAVRCYRRDGEIDEGGVQTLTRMVVARMPEVVDFIGADHLRAVCIMSGGIPRVLFQILRAVARVARRTETLPVSDFLIQTAIDSVRQDYLAISKEAVEGLRSIRETRSVDGLDQGTLDLLGRYFQATVVVQLANGEKWFMLHPLMERRLALIS